MPSLGKDYAGGILVGVAMQCIRADVSVGTIQMKTPALLKHSRLVIYVTEIALGTETSYVHIRVQNESKRYPVSKRSLGP